MPSNESAPRWVRLPGGNYDVLMTGDDLTPDEAAALVAYFEHCGITRAHAVRPHSGELPPGAIRDALPGEGRTA
jgi:hypothetical protein